MTRRHRRQVRREGAAVKSAWLDAEAWVRPRPRPAHPSVWLTDTAPHPVAVAEWRVDA